MDRCAECGTRAKARAYHRASKLHGGNYRTAASRRQATICDRCIDDAVTRMETDRACGHDNVTDHPWGTGRWDRASLLRLAGRPDLQRRDARKNPAPHDEPTEAARDAMEATDDALLKLGERLGVGATSEFQRTLAAERLQHHRARRDTALESNDR